MGERIEFQTSPERYRHWRLSFDGPVATLAMDVDENAGLFPGYLLKLNSYDLGVDIELADAVQRLRFEHPEVSAVVIRSGKERVFCAGANIRMLAGASHSHKVNFCKFTNETRNTLEESTQTYICAIQGSCAGGGYELALACHYILLADDASSAVSLPEAPLLAVLPGTGGLTRLTDKRKVRRDLADVFCTAEEGARGKRALDWRLVDEIAPNSTFEAAVAARAAAYPAKTSGPGVKLGPLERRFEDDGVRYSHVDVLIDRPARRATITLRGGSDLLTLARELDDALLHLRFNEEEIGLLAFRSEGDPATMLAAEAKLVGAEDWLSREILQYWKRVLKRIDLTSRSLVALIEPGSCFAGPLAEVVFACDRAYMREEEATLTLGPSSFGLMPMSNGITRLQTRFLGEPESVDAAMSLQGRRLDAKEALRAGLVTFVYDELDWDDEIRIFMEERASFSPDVLTGLEANLRFAGPETMETRIFARLTVWQNWIFNRPNATGEAGALRRYGSGKRGQFDMRRV